MSNVTIGETRYDVTVTEEQAILVEVGVPGLVGPTGPEGPQGEQGPQGEKGDTGTTNWLGQWTSIDYNKDDSVEYNGSSYICILDTTTQQPPSDPLYWDLVASEGSQGIQGEQGPQGTKGDTGDKGDQGDIGLTGPQGIQGDTGEKGDVGSQGPIGDTGPQGIQGDIGPIGPQGVPGNDGADGLDGLGVPAGGLTDQVLSKIDGTDNNTQWVDQTDASWGSITGTLSDQTDLQTALDGKEPANVNIQGHIIDVTNPHNVDKTQVGLDQVDNTSDVNKPVSTATQTQLDLKADQTSLDSTNIIVGDNQTAININKTDITNLETGKEDNLNNPISDGQVLSSLIDGTRSWIDAGGAGDVKELVNQAAHGFTTGQPLYFNGTDWNLAQADSDVTIGTQICEVIDTNSFYIIQIGDVEGLTGLVAGDWYYVSTSTPGNLTNVIPTLGINNPVGFAETVTKLHVEFLRANVVETVSAPGTISHGDLANLSIDDHTQYALADGSRGNFEPANGNIQTHISDITNPHIVTQTQVGLPNVDNTSDIDKPVSTLTQAGLDGKSDTTHNHDLSYSDINHNHTGVYEPVITKNTGFNLPLGTAVSTVSEGSHNHDGSYAPVSHNHVESNITDLDKYTQSEVDGFIAGREPANGNIQSHIGSTANPHNNTFIQLPDTPADFTTNAIKYLRVNATEDGVEFVDLPAGTTSWGAISGTLSDQTDLQTALDGKSGTGHNHSGTYEPANVNIQAHIIDTANPHSVTQTQVGLGNVDNTSDADKPISNLTQAGLDGKSDTSHLHTGVYEPVFTKNSGFNKVLGTNAGQVSEGNHVHTQYVEPTDYATATTGGTLKVRVSGTDAFFSTNGTNP